MFTQDLYNQILLDPPKRNPRLDSLFVVSGYATSAMAFRHLAESSAFKINLICGMTAHDGISLINHRGFRGLVTGNFAGRFSCSYIHKGAPVHSKVYLWCAGDTPEIAYCGSANYTQTGFGDVRQKEAVVDCSPAAARDYYNSLIASTINCASGGVEGVVGVYADERRKTKIKPAGKKVTVDYSGLGKVTVSLLVKNGTVANRSGLNWGQRPEENRNPNQAYIALPAQVYRSDFFPSRPLRFTLLTDDGQAIVAARAQDASKAIHTPHDNSLLGAYFRKRLGLRDGAHVKASDLRAYGRTDIDFYKIDDENYYMDFSV